MGIRATTQKNFSDGKQFEEIVIHRAQLNGLLPIRNLLTARFVYAGRIQMMKSELDLKLITRKGEVAYVDCKRFGGDRFSYSKLEPKQVERAITYNRWRVRSGFLVWFHELNRIQFYTGLLIEKKGPNSSFIADEGVSLGKLEVFSLRSIFELKDLLKIAE